MKPQLTPYQKAGLDKDGKFPPGAECPFEKRCRLAAGCHLVDAGPLAFSFSCGVARAFAVSTAHEK